MKTIITIEHTNKSDLSSILEKVSYDVSRGYTKSSGVFPASAYVPVAVAPVAPPPYPTDYDQSEQHIVQESAEISISTYEFYTE